MFLLLTSWRVNSKFVKIPSEAYVAAHWKRRPTLTEINDAVGSEALDADWLTAVQSGQPMMFEEITYELQEIML
jgi:hypothetical protein